MWANLTPTPPCFPRLDKLELAVEEMLKKDPSRDRSPGRQVIAWHGMAGIEAQGDEIPW